MLSGVAITITITAQVPVEEAEMSRLALRKRLAAPTGLIALGIGIAVVAPAQAQWSTPVKPPAGCGSTASGVPALALNTAGDFGGLLLFPWVCVHSRPGRGGHSPPKASRTMAMSGLAEWKPNAIRVSRRMRVLTDSTRALLRPYCRVVTMVPR